MTIRDDLELAVTEVLQDYGIALEGFVVAWEGAEISDDVEAVMSVHTDSRSTPTGELALIALVDAYGQSVQNRLVAKIEHEQRS